MGHEIDLSVITISSNLKYIKDCLESLYRALKSVKYEIILVDNASLDNIGKELKKSFSSLTVLRTENNRGFGENNNVALKIARGRYVLLLNDDTKIIDKNMFTEMIAWMDNHPQVGISSSALINSNQKTLQGSGGYFPTLPRVFAWMSFLDDVPIINKFIDSYHPSINYFKNSHEQDWVTGAFFLMRAELIKKIGLFDEDFFLYVEEVDYAYRAKLAGYKIWYLPKWKIVHHGQVSTGSENATVMEMQNLKLFYKKHYPSWQLPILVLFLKLGALIRIPIFGKVYAKAFNSI